MNSLLILIGIIMLIIAVAFAIIYAFLQITLYYKRRFNISMGPSIIAMCLAVNLFLISAMIYINNSQEKFILLFIIVAIVLFAYGTIRDMKVYGNMAIGAIGVQLLAALLQAFIVLIAVITIIIRKYVKCQNNQLRMVLNWTKYIWNI